MVAAVTEKTMVTPSLELVQLAEEAVDTAARRDVWLRHCGTLSVNVLNDEGTVADARVVLHGQVVDPALGDEAMSMSREELLLSWQERSWISNPKKATSPVFFFKRQTSVKRWRGPVKPGQWWHGTPRAAALVSILADWTAFSSV